MEANNSRRRSGSWSSVNFGPNDAVFGTSETYNKVAKVMREQHPKSYTTEDNPANYSGSVEMVYQWANPSKTDDPPYPFEKKFIGFAKSFATAKPTRLKHNQSAEQYYYGNQGYKRGSKAAVQHAAETRDKLHFIVDPSHDHVGTKGNRPNYSTAHEYRYAFRHKDDPAFQDKLVFHSPRGSIVQAPWEDSGTKQKWLDYANDRQEKRSQTIQTVQSSSPPAQRSNQSNSNNPLGKITKYFFK